MKNPYLICFIWLLGYLSIVYISSILIAIVYFDADNIYRQSSDIVDGLSYMFLLIVLGLVFKSKLSITLMTRGIIFAVLLGVCLRILIICVNHLIGNSVYPEIEYRLIFSINIVLLIPIVEEFFFRGVILNKLLESRISLIGGVLFSSFLFSLIHYDSGLITMIYALLTGVVLGLFYTKYGLASVIIVHVTDNLLWYMSRLFIPILDIW